jgi:hypothetical protein
LNSGLSSNESLSSYAFSLKLQDHTHREKRGLFSALNCILNFSTQSQPASIMIGLKSHWICLRVFWSARIFIQPLTKEIYNPLPPELVSTVGKWITAPMSYSRHPESLMYDSTWWTKSKFSLTLHLMHQILIWYVRQVYSNAREENAENGYVEESGKSRKWCASIWKHTRPTISMAETSSPWYHLEFINRYEVHVTGFGK